MGERCAKFWARQTRKIVTGRSDKKDEERERESAGLMPPHSMNVRVLCDACVDLQVAPCTSKQTKGAFG